MEQNIDKYKYFDNPIGCGSFSFVYKGIHKITNKKVAIKKINLNFNKNLNKEQIEKEINIMKSIKHNNIIKLYDSVYDKYNNVYIIMEYSHIGNLSTFLNNMPMKEKYVKIYMTQLSHATNYLYNHNIMHRDIKPENILVFNNQIIKLTDFGFAKIFNTNSDNELMSHTICGSPIYMAPEIIKCNKYSIKTDLWSIGIIFYQMIVGKLPYKASTHIELLNKIDTNPIYIPMDISISNYGCDLLFNLLQSDPNKRIGWKDFFNHKWFNNISKNYDINFPEIINDTYNNNDVEDKQYCIPMNPYDPLTPKKSKPIPINKTDKSDSDNSESDNNDDDNSYISPMFNTPIIFTPNNTNGYIIVEPDNNIKNDRSISESLMNYMNQTINYFLSFRISN